MNAPRSKQRFGWAEDETISSTLLSGVQAGQAAAWRRLVNLYQSRVYGWCRQQNLQPEDAWDVTQEVFLRVLDYAKGFSREHTGQSFGGWLCTITRSRVAEHGRKQARQPLGRGGTDVQKQLQELAEAADSSNSSAPRHDWFGIQVSWTGFGRNSSRRLGKPFTACSSRASPRPTSAERWTWTNTPCVKPSSVS